MKKRVVAFLLSMTLCSAMVAEAGAAAYVDPVSGVSQEAAEVSEEAFSDSEDAGFADQGQTEDAQTEESGVTEEDGIVTEGSEEEQQPSDGASDIITDDTADSVVDGETEGAEDVPAEDDSTEGTDQEEGIMEDLFSSGDEAAVSDQQTDAPEVTEEDASQAALAFEKEDENGKTVTLSCIRWEEENSKWKLRKLPKTAENTATEETETPSAGEVQTLEETAEDLAVQEEGFEGAEAEADDTAVPETIPEMEDMSGELTGPETADVPEPETEAAADVQTAAPEYYKNQIITVITMDELGQNKLSEGTYYFDENGYLVTGRTTVKPGTAGYDRGEAAGYYFLDSSKAKVTNPGTRAADAVTPYNSDLGKMQKNIQWDWDGTRFHNYGEDGAETVIKDNLYTINNATYYLQSGKPYANGVLYIKAKKAYYAFSANKNAAGIPGQMIKNGWASRATSKGAQWLYFGNDGRNQKQKSGAYRIYPKNNALYLLNSSGYLVRNKMMRAANKGYYLADKNGKVYTNKLVKYGRYRYYFTSSGKCAGWKNRWVKLNAANGRYYYFGKVAGRVQEKRGIQKVTVGRKFIGWFQFASNGNHFQDRMVSGRYYLPDGRMASGLRKVKGAYYFFERSSSKKYRGKMYKGTWVKYRNKYYLATSKGKLIVSGWRTYRGEKYYFKNCVALTNQNIQYKDGTYGYLDSRGRFNTGWTIISNSRNLVQYRDLKTGKKLRNCTKTIAGVNYRFDKKGYRVNDRTKEFRQKSYYVECDRVNGVMTVYTNSSKTIPIKTIRVSVGKAETPTPLGPYTIKRADRWQLLMGPSYGQYGSHVTGGIYIHSIACGQPNPYNLPAAEYMKLGNPASHGCIRCCVADAKWIWENCNGSRIKIIDGVYSDKNTTKGPLGRNPITPLRGSGNFDPTDPSV